jgi:hypothetical protein
MAVSGLYFSIYLLKLKAFLLPPDLTSIGTAQGQRFYVNLFRIRSFAEG